jgi:hypothetical protein
MPCGPGWSVRGRIRSRRSASMKCSNSLRPLRSTALSSTASTCSSPSRTRALTRRATTSKSSPIKSRQRIWKSALWSRRYGRRWAAAPPWATRPTASGSSRWSAKPAASASNCASSASATAAWCEGFRGKRRGLGQGSHRQYPRNCQHLPASLRCRRRQWRASRR